MMMDYSGLLLTLILTATQTTSLHNYCKSDVYSSASGMADFEQLTTLQYCLIDNCTIMRTDTGQRLNIVYTTQSHLVVTPTDGQTSVVISKNDPELFCSTPIITDIVQDIGLISLPLIALVSGYIAVVHMMFEEIRGTFGKLMMLQNVVLVYHSLNAITLFITHHYVTVSSMMPCYLLTISLLEAILISDAFATSFLTYLVYLIHQSYESRPVTEEMNKQFYKHAIMFVLGLSLLFGIFVVSYDFITGAYKDTLLPHGHCGYGIESEYTTQRIIYAYIFLNKIIQSLILVAYFIYHYKLNKKLKMVRGIANIDTQQNELFLKIAVTMAATLGISHIVFAFSVYFDSEILLRITGFLFSAQQFVIMSFFMCTRNILQLCKQRFCTTTKIYPQMS